MSDVDLGFETAAEHARRFNVTIRTLDNWRNQPAGGLPYTTAGRKILFNVNWTKEWLESRRRVNNPTIPPERQRRGRAA
jgi:hypothetical protein